MTRGTLSETYLLYQSWQSAPFDAELRPHNRGCPEYRAAGNVDYAANGLRFTASIR